MGFPITPNDLHFVVKFSMGKGTGVELDPASVFTMTTTKFVPSTADLMRATNTTEEKHEWLCFTDPHTSAGMSMDGDEAS